MTQRASHRALAARALALLAIALGLAGAPSPSRAESAAPVVVELFTSQGCSACPPADAYLAELTERSGVIALTMNVHYWDYLGWRDGLARPEHAERQNAYADSHRSRPIYTPQMIVHGGWSVIGSRRSDVEAAIAMAAQKAPAAMVALRRDGDQLVIDIAATGAGMGDVEACNVLLVAFEAEKEVAIGAGENAGHTIVYRNVVREIRELGQWRGADRSMNADIDPGAGGYAVLLQGPHGGPIFAAAELRFAD